LTEKVAIVTGAAIGTGSAIARRVAAAGAVIAAALLQTKRASQRSLDQIAHL
jgi:NAD(P)-dependent dehydrogenase (short-subunit alcohol dehydrogenase family)